MTPDEVERLIEGLDCGYMNCGNSEFICISKIAVDRAIAALRALTAAPDEVPMEPTKWNHGCMVAGMNLDLWLDRCPHCGMPGPSDAAPKSAPEGPAMKALRELVELRQMCSATMEDAWRKFYCGEAVDRWTRAEHLVFASSPPTEKKEGES